MTGTKASERTVEGARAVEGTSTTAQHATTASVGAERDTANARPDDEMRCTLCGLRACWTG